MILTSRSWVDAGEFGQGNGDAHVCDRGEDDTVNQSGRSPLEKCQLDTAGNTGPAVAYHKGEGHNIPGVELCLVRRASNDEGFNSTISHACGTFYLCRFPSVQTSCKAMVSHRCSPSLMFSCPWC